MKYYKLIARSDLYIKHYNIRANNIKDACKKAKEKFAREFKVFNAKIQLDHNDLENHIDELFETLYDSIKN